MCLYLQTFIKLSLNAMFSQIRKHTSRPSLTLQIFCVFFFLQKNNFKSYRYFARCFKSLIAKFNINMLLRISHTFSKTVLERIYFTENTQRCTGTCLVAVTLAYSIPGHSKTKYVWEREKTKTVTCRCIDTVWLLDLLLAEKS